MACAHPLFIKNPLYKTTHSTLKSKKQFFEVPCGYCLNCRVDRRNFLEDCAREEYKKFGYGAFVTCTYDNYQLLSNCVRSSNGDLLASLSVKDSQNFIKNLRSYMDYHNINCIQANRKFKYISTGEYGGQFGRPHIHFLFFGLDYDFCKKMFKECWFGGYIKSLPILKGGIRYVLKYLDKQVKGKQAEDLYDNNGLERPFSHHSNSFGFDYFYAHMDEILANNCMYQSKYGVKRPLSPYLKNKFLGRHVTDHSQLRDILSSYRVKSDNKSASGSSYSLKQVNEYLHEMSLRRERSLIAQCRNNGVGVDSQLPDVNWENMSQIPKLVNLAYDFCVYGDVVPF